MGLAQILAIIIFVTMFVMIVIDKIERQYVTLGCGVLTLVLFFFFPKVLGLKAVSEVVNFKAIAQPHFWYVTKHVSEESAGINWATIIFIAGMMIMVEGMAHSGFFRWLCLKLAKLVHYKPIPLFVAFMIMSSILAMFIDSITVILFLAAVTVELARLLKIDPIPMILSEIFCANLGGSATMCGDPPNIIIGTSMHYSFFDFLTNTGLIALISLVLIILYFFWIFRKKLIEEEHMTIDTSTIPEPKEAIVNKRDFVLSSIIFGLAVILLITHSITGLTVAFIGVFIAVLTLIAAGKNIPTIIKKVDYKTLLFFVGLFVVVGGLELTGFLKTIADGIGHISGGNPYIVIIIVLWLSAIASAFVDNIPFAATMVPVIIGLSGGHAPTAIQSNYRHVLAWTLSMGTDVGGSATPIGASANVVGTSVAAKHGYMIGWGKYCKSAVPATVIVMLVSMGVIFIRYNNEIQAMIKSIAK